MKKQLAGCACALMLVALLAACTAPEGSSSSGGGDGPVKIGVVFGVGDAARWPQELSYMEERAAELGADIETRLNKTDEPTTWQQDCKDLVDGGVDVLIITPRNANDTEEVSAYAQEKDVKVISYARAALGSHVDLFVGYDSGRIGQLMGKFLSEMVYEGDYIILRGDPQDNNATLLYEGSMRYINPLKGSIDVLLDEAVEGWSTDAAKQMVMEAVSANGNHVDAILAPNDKIASACAEALSDLGVTDPVVITGMDAELDAAQRIVNGTQAMTVYMDLKELATTAVDEACRMAEGQAPNANAKFDNGTAEGVDSSLITGNVVTKENLDKTLIDSGYFTREEVYGSAA